MTRPTSLSGEGKLKRKEFDFYLFRCYRIWEDVKIKALKPDEINKAENDFYEWFEKNLK